jgi:hypothetical protein
MKNKQDDSASTAKNRANDNPFKPVTLKPASLRQEPTRPIKSSEVRASEIPIVSFGDHASPARPVSERPFSFSSLNEVRPDLKPEASRSVQLAPVAVTPMQMQKMRERRVGARELGWSIKGFQIKIES